MKNLRKIVIVEDDPDIALLATIALRDLGGFEVTHFLSGTAALAEVVSIAPDLIILDCRMPDMNGDEVFAALKLIPQTANTPVVFMTANIMPADVEALRGSGAVDVIAKPFDPLSLADRVREIWTTV